MGVAVSVAPSPASARTGFDMTAWRLEDYLSLQSFACLWGMVPGSITDEDSPFNECAHAYLAAGYALKGETERARAELAEAQGLSNIYSSLTSVEKSNWFDNPKVRALAEATYFPALRKAGMPDE